MDGDEIGQPTTRQGHGPGLAARGKRRWREGELDCDLDLDSVLLGLGRLGCGLGRRSC